ncbi:MAG: hypothetical protein ACPLRA_04690, partial [Candidatus Saccharicenans sp.]
MKFKTVMILKAIICLGFGPVLLFFPDPLLKLMGAAFCAGAAFTAREYGAALVGNLFLTWFARNAEPSKVRQAIALNLCIYDAIGFVVTLYFILSGVLNPLAWAIAAVYLFFAIAFAFFISPKTKVA